MGKIKTVIIKKCSNSPHFWYSGCIGDIFKVISYPGYKQYRVVIGSNDTLTNLYIDKVDCKIVPKDNSKYSDKEARQVVTDLLEVNKRIKKLKDKYTYKDK